MAINDIVMAVVRGRFVGTTETRMMFTAQQTSGTGIGQASWEDYLHDVFDPMMPEVTNLWTADSFELHRADHWNVTKGEEVWDPLGEFTLSLAGSSSQQPLPLQIAAVLIGKTAVKRAMGRKFFPGVTENLSNEGLLDPAILLALASSGLAYVSPFGTGHDELFTPGILHKGGTFVSFSGFLVDAIFGTQRRRKQGVGI